MGLSAVGLGLAAIRLGLSVANGTGLAGDPNGSLDGGAGSTHIKDSRYSDLGPRIKILKRRDEYITHFVANENAALKTWANWHQEGKFVALETFDWLWTGVQTNDDQESGVGDLIESESDMYVHHLGNRNARAYLGFIEW